ncbi:MerR family transcriptional regulator [Nocardia macrotermitis]|uniref:Putative HTH-type transcriptional regulator n=1 Tax=Nocardia macrotermitis TaxID=2585198 RepID=A0A7K0D0I0_9NOCA|nr:MerR family transcriptional regulator [Nocardia macrotermitis]MQY19235.1 putative HTH-type transcriptional regulator [Nocardia macrotermitis]
MGTTTWDRITDRDDPEYGRARYSIGAVSELSGLTRDTLRWYERIGLLDSVGRDHAGKRRFSERDLDWLALIGKLRRTGMTVADMIRYAELVRAGEATYPERLEMFRHTRADVVAQIAELRQTLAVLDCKIALYEGNADAADWRAVSVAQ